VMPFTTSCKKKLMRGDPACREPARSCPVVF